MIKKNCDSCRYWGCEIMKKTMESEENGKIKPENITCNNWSKKIEDKTD